MKKYLRLIEKAQTKLILKLRKKGIYENFGQNEYRDFKDLVNADDSLSYGEKADLASRFSEMVDLVNKQSSKLI